MNVLVVGLGSMGKRRIRCLQELSIDNICGFDLRKDRIFETKTKYGISCIDSNVEEQIEKSDIVLISVPPDSHDEYMKLCLKHKKHFFVEASVIDNELKKMYKEAKDIGVLAIPSATLLFHPAIQKIQSIVKNSHLGKISNFIYHSGQYLPDWHIYENVSEYYVSNPKTGGAREIVPFELVWLTRCFGYPKEVMARVEKTIDIPGAEKISDTFSLLLKFNDFIGTLIVDVVSRCATRRLSIIGETGFLYWDWDKSKIEVFNSISNTSSEVVYSVRSSEVGYNSNITEQMYIDEMDCFFKSVFNAGEFPHNLEEDSKILEILSGAEKSAITGKNIRF